MDRPETTPTFLARRTFGGSASIEEIAWPWKSLVKAASRL